jgi:hypothetical protein
MRLISPGTAPPADVDRYLLPFEQEVITVRFHPASLIGPAALAVAGLVTAIVLTGLRGFSYDARLVVWLVCGLLMLYLVLRVVNRSVSYFVVTSERLLVLKGVLARDISMIPVGYAARMKVRRSLMGLLFGYGQFIIDPVGQDQALRYVNFIPYPEQIYLELCSLVYPHGAKPDDDEK